MRFWVVHQPYLPTVGRVTPENYFILPRVKNIDKQETDVK
jgi:hypothetical protein